MPMIIGNNNKKIVKISVSLLERDSCVVMSKRKKTLSEKIKPSFMVTLDKLLCKCCYFTIY